MFIWRSLQFTKHIRSHHLNLVYQARTRAQRVWETGQVSQPLAPACVPLSAVLSLVPAAGGQAGSISS